MMDATVSSEQDVSVQSSTEAEIISTYTDEPTTKTSVSAALIPNHYVISSGGIYAAGFSGSDIPLWLQEAISSQLQDGTKELQDVIDDLSTFVRQLESGVNQEIQNLHTAYEQTNGLITSVVTKTADDIAAVYEEMATKVTPDEVEAAINTLIAAQFNGGDSSSWFLSQIDTYASQIEAQSQSIDSIVSVINDESTGIEATASATRTLESYVGVQDGLPNDTGLLRDVSELLTQSDGLYETVSDTHSIVDADTDAPLTDQEPYASWLAIDQSNNTITERLKHTGDIYIRYHYDTAGRKVYDASWRFYRGDKYATNTDSDGFGWFLLSDTETINAMTAALYASDMADQKRRVFTQTPYPPYDVGDLWITDSQDLYSAIVAKTITQTYEESDWGPATKYTDDSKVEQVISGVVTLDLSKHLVGTDTLESYLKSEIDTKVVVFSGTRDERLALTEMKENDLYIEYAAETSSSGITVDTTNTYRYSYDENGNLVWQQINSNTNLLSLADLADGKRTIYGGVEIPLQPNDNDLWIPDGDNGDFRQGEIYIAKDGQWVSATRYSDDLSTLDQAQKEYVSVVTKALADGVLTPEEELLIQNAQDAVDAAKERIYGNDFLQNTIAKYEVEKVQGDYTDFVDSIHSMLTDATSDGLIDEAEARLIAQISAEEQARIADIAARIEAEAVLNGKISTEEQARIDALAELDSAHKLYTEIVAKAIADQVITDEEWQLISFAESAVLEAQSRVNTMSAMIDQLQLDVSSISDDLQRQIDQKIQTYYQIAQPYPELVFSPDDVDTPEYQEALKHTDDLWVNLGSADLASYKYGLEATDTTHTFKWFSHAVPASLVDKIDGKKTIYSGTTLPIDPSKDDLWIPTETVTVDGITYQGQEIYQYVEDVSDGALYWERPLKYTDDSSLEAFIATTYTEQIASIETQIDHQIEYWFFDEEHAADWVDPKDAWDTDTLKRVHHGDILYFRDTENTYYYDRQTNAWLDYPGSNEVIAWLAQNQRTADNKAVVIYSETPPETANGQPLEPNDLWIDASIDADTGTPKNTTYRWDGGQWVNITDSRIFSTASAVTELQAQVEELNSTSVNLTESASVMAGYFQLWDGVSEPQIGYYKLDSDGTTWIYLGGSLGENNDGWVKQNPQDDILESQTMSYTQQTAQVYSNYTQDIQRALDVATLDGKIDSSEQELIEKLLQEEQARIDGLTEAAIATAALDGKITEEEAARIAAVDQAVEQLDAAYKEYVRIVMEAMADGELSYEERQTISAAQAAVDAATDRLNGIETNIDTLGSLISQEEQDRINAINAETEARTQAILERIQKEAELDGKITDEEQARIDAVADLDAAYRRYNQIVASAIADGELTEEEKLVIADAEDVVNQAKERIYGDSYLRATAGTYEDHVRSVSTELSIAALDGKIDASEQELIQKILDEEQARIASLEEQAQVDAMLDGKITAEEQARIDAVSELDSAYKTYSAVVAKAIADGELTDDEQLLIADAYESVELAQSKLATAYETALTATETATQAYNWAAGASSLITSPEGYVTGWSYGDGSNTTSRFTIHGEYFDVRFPSGAGMHVEEDGLWFTRATGERHKTLKSIQTGIAKNGETITISGFYDRVPTIMVSPQSIQTYDPSESDQPQNLDCYVFNLSGSIETGEWEFTPTANLSIAQIEHTATIQLPDNYGSYFDFQCDNETNNTIQDESRFSIASGEISAEVTIAEADTLYFELSFSGEAWNINTNDLMYCDQSKYAILFDYSDGSSDTFDNICAGNLLPGPTINSYTPSTTLSVVVQPTKPITGYRVYLYISGPLLDAGTYTNDYGVEAPNVSGYMSPKVVCREVSTGKIVSPEGTLNWLAIS